MATIISTITSTGIMLSPSDNPVSVTGTITPTSGIALYGPGDGTNTWTIDNAGLISASDTASGYGIQLGVQRRRRQPESLPIVRAGRSMAEASP